IGQSTMPSVLVRATVDGAVEFAFATGTAGAYSTQAAVLAEGTLNAMFMKKVRAAALGLVVLAVLASGVVQLHQLYAAPVPASLEPWFEEVPIVQVVPQPQPHLQEQPAPKVVEEPTPLTVLV